MVIACCVLVAGAALVRRAAALPQAGAPASGTEERASGRELPAVVDLALALEIFCARGLDVLIADAALDSARGDERIARTVTNPVLGLGAGRTKTYDPSVCAGCSDRLLQAEVSDQAAVFDALVGKRRLRTDVARAALEAAARSKADAERTGSLAVKEQYLAVELAGAAREYARSTVISAAETFRLVDLRYRKGAVSEADSAAAESAKLEAEQAESQAEQAERQAKVALAFLLGVRGPTPEFSVGDEFARSLVPARLAGATSESLLALALAGRPDLQAQAAQRARAEAGLALARRQRIPDLTLSLGYSEEGRGQNAIQPPTTVLGVSFALPVFDRQQGEIVKAQADARAQDLELAKQAAQVRADVEVQYAAYAAARTRVERMESRLLERAERARDLVKIQYEKGAASLLDLLVAERTLTAVRAEHLQDLSEYWTAVFGLEAAVGEELR